ncbi:ABSCISIC ACID-INSENSITIVE 5-like protein 2 [Telopea speciosissima]|uniref:ABSCISIC ACID-INSENSITIVE 5-like protein 2 n=1 Tax=Telopea speciosissima TaxID=54955 RepID=UPI001CC6490A|nr:ABSCISIC ACID-INSENSITIVE 5-like protein 2 [Telopea speciosissima]
MGFRTMVSPNRGQTAHFPPFGRQGALYNLTLDEVQSQLENSGKTLDNMNLDELVKSVIAAEQDQVVQNAAASSSSSTAVTPGNLNLNRTLSRKTVDEVWKEIAHQEEQGNAGHEESVQRQPTLGETTLEDFLVRAGAINAGNQDSVVDAQSLVATDTIVAAASQQADWFQFQMAAVQQQQQQMSVLDSTMPLSVSVFGTSGVDVGYHENQLALSMPMPLVVAAPAESQAAVDRKRRFSDEIMEKTIERRQKRMIKNRESAARSRARKQAYTNKLENDLAQLKETNEGLIKEKETRMLFPSDPTSVPKYQLRRTSSAPY